MKMWVSGFLVDRDRVLVVRQPQLERWLLPGAALRVESPVLRLKQVLAGVPFGVVGLASLWERGGVTGATYVLAHRGTGAVELREPWGGGSPPVPPHANGSPPAGSAVHRRPPVPAGERPECRWLPLEEIEAGIAAGWVAMDEGEWQGVQQMLDSSGPS